ncbi:peroxisomal N(1)-acetyl-spermine/spermidine oxidase-like [Solea senegalensis]|uniref:Peroxisomal N(1)-acetyl-spermine/spermidine oxidase-like n=1 Tax=Solea senegalensis TaxID=28829 RepID=A0AAV6S307_SOLSE|nr:peroxisomal N(1)-acetyl-spermine/spermidine oxidase-like [Solea senegalensis]
MRVGRDGERPQLASLPGALQSRGLLKHCLSVWYFVQALRRAGERWKDKTTRELLLCAISTLLKKECCEQGTHTMDDVDLAGFTMFKYLPGLDCTLPSGFEGLIENLMSELPSGVVSYNRPVTCVHWNNMSSEANTVTVECDDGEMIAADHVIVTVPLGYLKRHHSTLFSPPLPPHKLKSIGKVGFGTCNKIYVEFESPWWDSHCEVIYLLWKDEWDLSVQRSDISKSWMRKIGGFIVLPPSERNSHILCGWIAGHEAEYMETLTEREVRRSITELVCTFTGNPAISPKRILRTQWFHQPWTCGSYSYPKIGCSTQDRENIMEPLPGKGSQSQPLQVLFAGEATHPSYYGTVHGAVFSGWREADRLISHYSPIAQTNQNTKRSCGDYGIAAAHRLINAGFHNVRILEATARSGGRIKTSRLGDSVVEIGANWIHGPCKENPVFCLAQKYGLLDPEALTPENQAIDVGGHPPGLPNIFSSSGRKLNAEDIYPAQKMFSELLGESEGFQSQGGETCPSLGDFIRSEVRQRAADEWKHLDANTRSLQLCAISSMLKLECCTNGAHSLDEVALGANGLYKTLPGLDCTFPGGYEGLIKSLMSELPSGLVTYSRPVRCVHWSNSEKTRTPVIVECNDGEKITADHVIVTHAVAQLFRRFTGECEVFEMLLN